MSQQKYEVLNQGGETVIKAWTKGVLFEEQARKQVLNLTQIPFIHKWVAVMPDVHWGMGATIGSVIPTVGAIIPAAVGVDIGCGMMAVQTSLKGSDLPDNLFEMRNTIERAVPHGRSNHGGRRDKGAWNDLPDNVAQAWKGSLQDDFEEICERHGKLKNSNNVHHLGTLGTGNHFIEVCLDEKQNVWVMLHSGSRGVGNKVGMHFINQAKKDMKTWMINLPDENLAYLPEGTQHFYDYIKAVDWAQRFAMLNRQIMMDNVLRNLAKLKSLPEFTTDKMAVNCHHNYVKNEFHYGKKVWVTRKGAVRAGEGELGIIPGSMGARSFIVRGKGNAESFCSCSHGAGRAMSRTRAKKEFTIEDHKRATAGVECRVDADVVDETPGAYKDIDAVMRAQDDLVDIVHTLKQVVCVKG